MMSSKNLSQISNISAEAVTELCFDKFKSLPKTGKPNDKEWTVLAGVVLHNKETGKNEVISLGCGTKCLGKSKLCAQGLTLSDSHAEVLARRGLLRYIYYQLNKTIKKTDDNDCIFQWMPEKQKFQLKDEFTLHFLSTQTPCGDACIIDSYKQDDYIEEPLIKRTKVKEVKTEENVGCVMNSVYTGAKLIGSQHTDDMEQLVGAVRTKPGRGERTLSISCSDKLAKWQVMGVQGALLDHLLAAPIYFDTLNFWGENKLAILERAIWKRFLGNDHKHFKYSIHIPKIRICHKPEFPYVQDNKKQPSPNGLVWCNIPESMKPYEISINGKRQGITTKKLQSPKSALKISKFYLFKEFLNIVKLKENLLCSVNIIVPETYFECKFLAKDYQSAWSDVKLNYFKQWSQKPDNLLKFSVQEIESKESDK